MKPFAARPFTSATHDTVTKRLNISIYANKGAGAREAERAVMDLDQLHTFLEIVRLKSFSKAAQTCYRTQPAISAQVRQLEQELNTTLFDRLGTKISLTVAGRIFAEHAEQILALRRRAQDAINELEKMPRGELLIAANEATGIHVVPV